MNPRPLMIRSRLYMRSRVFEFDQALPDGQGRRLASSLVFVATGGTTAALILAKLQSSQPFRPELVDRPRGLGRESVVVVVRN